MKYLIAQGQSIHEVFVDCFYCGKKQVWMRLFQDLYKGKYVAVCGACYKEQNKKAGK